MTGQCAAVPIGVASACWVLELADSTIGANRPEYGGTLTIFDYLSRCPALPSVRHDFLKLT